jgi:lysyl-tRNA synthetase class 2
MKLVEDLYKYIAEQAFGTLQFKIGNFDVDLAGDWPRIDYAETIKEKIGIDVLSASEDELISKLKELGVKFDPNDRRG